MDSESPAKLASRALQEGGPEPAEVPDQGPRISRAMFRQMMQAHNVALRASAAASAKAKAAATGVFAAQQPSLPAQSSRSIGLPEWVQSLSPSHSAWFLGGILFCKACGGMSTGSISKSRTLVGECTRTSVEGTAKRTALLLRGYLPRSFSTWPDGYPEATAQRLPMQLSWESSRWIPPAVITRDEVPRIGSNRREDRGPARGRPRKPFS